MMTISHKRIAWRGKIKREAPSVVAQLKMPKVQGSHKELTKVTSSTRSNLWFRRNTRQLSSIEREKFTNIKLGDEMTVRKTKRVQNNWFVKQK